MTRGKLVAGLLVLSSLALSAPAGAQELVLDGTMEAAGTAEWGAYGAADFTKGDQPNTGSYAMLLSQLGVWGGFQQTVAGVAAGRIYRIRMSYYRLSGTFGFRVGLGSSNYDFEGKELRTSTSRPAYVFFERYVRLPAVLPGSLRLVFLSNGEAYVDDVSVVEVPALPTSAIVDGDMEAADASAWMAYGGVFSKTSDAAHAGTQSMRIDVGGIQQADLPLAANSVYQLDVWYRRIAGTFRVRVGINSSNVDYEGAQLSDASSATGVWQHHTRIVEMPASLAGSVRLVIVGNAYVDDVQLRKLELVDDWSAEASGTDAWTLYGAAQTLEKVVDDVYGGLQALRLVAGGIQQTTIDVEPGKAYDLWVPYNVLSGRLRVRLGTTSSNVDFEGLQFQTYFSGGWQEHHRIFTVPAVYDGDLRLVIEATGEVRLDEVSIRPASLD